MALHTSVTFLFSPRRHRSISCVTRKCLAFLLNALSQLVGQTHEIGAQSDISVSWALYLLSRAAGHERLGKLAETL